MQFRPPTPGRSLAGHVIRRLLVDAGTACEANCFDDDDCMSVNLGPKNQGTRLCELSSSDDNLHPEGLEERSKFIYKSVLVSKSSARRASACIQEISASPFVTLQTIREVEPKSVNQLFITRWSAIDHFFFFFPSPTSEVFTNFKSTQFTLVSKLTNRDSKKFTKELKAGATSWHPF